MNPLPAFRRDLQVSAAPARPGEKPAYLIRDPLTRDAFQFGEEEYFCCTCLDGKATADDVQARFEQEFHRPYSNQSLRTLLAQLADLRLLDRKFNPADDFTPAANAAASQSASPPSLTATTPADNDAALGDDDEDKPGTRRENYWPLCNPTAFIGSILPGVRRLRRFWLGLVWSLIVGVPLTVFLLYKFNDLLYQDLATRSLPLSFLGHLAFILIGVNFLRCLCSALIIAHYGGTVREFGIRMRFSLIPRFYIDKSAVNGFPRHAKLWTYGTTPLVHIVILVLGATIWALSRRQSSTLPSWGILMTQSGLIGFIMASSPFRTSYGYKWLVTFFNLPHDMLQTALRVFIMTVTRRPLPTSMSSAKRWKSLAYGIVLIGFWAFFAIKIVSSIVGGLAETFPQVFGSATEFLLYLLVIGLVLRWLLPRLSRFGGYGKSREEQELAVAAPASAKRMSWPQRLGWAAAALIIAIMPFPFRPGGYVELLPPQKQSLMTPISGKIVEVYATGGDGQYLPAGAPVALMMSASLENEIATWREKVREEESIAAQARAANAQLQVGARPEELDEARARVEAATQEVAIARTQLDSARVTARYAQQEVVRLDALFREGALPSLELENARERAEVSTIDVTAKQQVMDARIAALAEEAASLALITKGATAEQLEGSRQQVEAAEASLRAGRQQLAFSESRSRDATLKMPIEGYLLDPYLARKIGTYFAEGSLFTSAQNDRNMAVQMDLPEYDAAYVGTGAVAEVRLLAYPDQELQGTVVSIEPAPSEVLYGRVFHLRITLEHARPDMKPGLTGYGKISSGYRPMIWVVTRHIVRFFQVEIWSWLP